LNIESADIVYNADMCGGQSTNFANYKMKLRVDASGDAPTQFIGPPMVWQKCCTLRSRPKLTMYECKNLLGGKCAMVFLDG